uniref:Uncharacterized protein n=1 Tax=Chenopodium quinoa TaxID=63459 RepID=A0A803LXQ2_CHEQI
MPRQNQQHCKIRKRVSSSSSSSSSVVKKKNYKLKKGVLVGKLIMESARKLAATLWEINGFHSPARPKEEILEEKRVRSSNNHPHTPACDQLQIDGSKVGGHRRRSSATSQKLEIAGGGPETLGKATSIEVSSHMAGLGENNMNVKTRLKDVNNSLIASKELVKVLFRILSQEEQHSSRITLVSALRVELDRARLQVDKLIQDQRFYCNQMDALLKHFAEEKAAWKSRERERIREAVSSLARELEIERKLRRQAERLNKKLGMELADTKADFTTALKELDSEKRAREILEQTCDELARGIGEERVEVEELKRESAKAREEVEKERQMLQLADVLREERVQMKLSEARYEYEEKNAALERLKNDIETHLKSKENGTNNLDEKTGLKHFLRTMQIGALENGGDQGEGDSGDSELHSIELNMDNNNRSYKWSFACEGNNQGDSRRGSMDEVFKGRRSLSEKIQWESICLQRKTSDGGIEWDFTANNKLGSINGFDVGRPSQVCEVGATNEDVDDGDESFKRYSPVDKSHRISSFHGSPISTGNSSRLREACSAILQDLASKREQLQLEGQSRVNNI